MSESGLAAALAAVQASLPSIAKSETAEVEGTTKAGRPFKYKYSYADLATISKAVLPLLGANGLAWIARPTLREDGKFVLAYELLHISGESRAGDYPLTGVTAQEMGSAISYARRYALCSVTGIAPEEDDDDGASASKRRYDDEHVEPEPELATREQLANYRTLVNDINTAMDDDRLRELYQLVPVEFKNGAITAGQGNEARALILQRREALAAAPDEPGLTDSTRKHVFGLFRAVKLTDKDDQHKYATDTLKRQVESFTTLTEAEGLTLAAALEGRKRAMGVAK